MDAVRQSSPRQRRLSQGCSSQICSILPTFSLKILLSSWFLHSDIFPFSSLKLSLTHWPDTLFLTMHCNGRNMASSLSTGSLFVCLSACYTCCTILPTFFFEDPQEAWSWSQPPCLLASCKHLWSPPSWYSTNRLSELWKKILAHFHEGFALVRWLKSQHWNCRLLFWDKDLAVQNFIRLPQATGFIIFAERRVFDNGLGSSEPNLDVWDYHGGSTKTEFNSSLLLDDSFLGSSS